MVEELEVNWNPDHYGGSHRRFRPVKTAPIIPNTFKDLKLGILSERWTFDENILPTIEDLGDKKGVRISGIAAMGDVVSRNNRKYIEEELIKSARTWIGKAITLNHSPPRQGMEGFDQNKILGDIRWMEYENGKMRYAGVVKKEPFASMLREGSTKLKKVSIEADFLTNECPECGKFFPSDKAFYEHTAKEHFNKNLAQVPRGIIGSALSLLLNAEPGIEVTTLEVREMVDGTRPFSQLAEALCVMNEGFAVHKEGQVLAGPGTVSIPDKKLAEYIEKKGSEYCVMSHTTGKEIKCFPTEQEAKDMLAAMHTHETKDVWKINASYLEIHEDKKVREAFDVVYQHMADAVKVADKRAEDAENKIGLDKLTETVTEKNTLKETVDSQHKQIVEMETELCRREELVETNKKLQIENDNIRDKVKGQFKGRAKEPVKVDTSASTWSPDKI